MEDYKPKEELEIRKEISSIHANLDNLGERIQNLKEQLRPVLNDTLGNCKEPKDDKCGCLCPLGREFYSINEQIEFLINEIKEMLKDCLL